MKVVFEGTIDEIAEEMRQFLSAELGFCSPVEPVLEPIPELMRMPISEFELSARAVSTICRMFEQTHDEPEEDVLARVTPAMLFKNTKAEVKRVKFCGIKTINEFDDIRRKVGIPYWGYDPEATK